MHTTIITFSKSEPPLGAVLTCSLIGVPFQWGAKTNLSLSPLVTLGSSHAISRHVARLHPSLDFYPSNILHRTEVDHWLSLSCGPLECQNDLSGILEHLNNALAPSTYLTAGKLTIADLELFSILLKSKEWKLKQSSRAEYPHVLRWFNQIKDKVTSILTSLPGDVVVEAPSLAGPSAKKDEGKFVDLPGAEMGKVVVRFPPEASGYLHIGHAKAALLNQHYKKAFQGKLIMRFDDTNPDKEKADFEKVILEDLTLLGISPDLFTHSSDHFETMLKLCEDLLKRGLAFVDDTDAETMKKEREEKRPSRRRDTSPSANLALWGEMQRGSEVGQRCCVRAKIDMGSANGCLRDPTIYRCKMEPHVRTGRRFNVYPTYDFACPIVDSLEGVTHALRTTEYHDRDDQYSWFIEKLSLRRPYIYEYSRLNMNNTVLSKRKLAWFVSEGLVDGWDDPRFPTVRGILRRGMTVEGLKDFIVAQGSSRSVVNMEWDKIWAFNKKVVDGEAPRYTALQGALVPVTVLCATEQRTEAQKHPKDPSKGSKTIWLGPKVFIEAADAAILTEGENATFINWGNLKVVSIERGGGGEVKGVQVEPNPSNTDYKKTPKLTWLCETPKAPWTPVVCSYFDHLISKGVLAKDEDFKEFVNPVTRTDVQMVGDDALKNLRVGDIIQLQRKGFFRVDEPYRPFSASSCVEGPVVLFFIPDGHTKDSPAVAHTLKKPQDAKLPPSEPRRESSRTALEIHQKVKDQGDKIRKLKGDKTDKGIVMPQVEILKALKAEFKAHTGLEWTPDMDVSQFSGGEAAAPVPPNKDSPSVALDLHTKIQRQGDKVRILKAEKADKLEIKKEVDILLALKKDFKDVLNVEWKPDLDINSLTKGVPKTPSSEPGSKVASSVELSNLNTKIQRQGDKVRALKAEKADKLEIKKEVDVLLALKKDFKDVSNVEWKPDLDISSLTKGVPKTPSSEPGPKVASSVELSTLIEQQGNKVRSLKTAQAAKDTVKAEVDVLLKLKKDFLAATGTEWKPGLDLKQREVPGNPLQSQGPVSNNPRGGEELHELIKQQGDKVRNLKSAGSDKDTIKSAVEVLLVHKAHFKKVTGVEWKPNTECPPLSQTPPKPTEIKAVQIHDEIKSQGDKVRELKAGKADKDVIKAQVDILLGLKKDFKNLTDIDWKPDLDPSVLVSSNSDLVKSGSEPTKSKAPERKKPDAKSEEPAKRQTRLGLEARKRDNLAEWYSQVITKSEMVEYYNVSGCYILRPWSYGIWERIKEFFDAKIKEMGVENAYFPIFVSREALEKEKTHIADFSPEVAWVTRSGSSDMAEPVAIRPTSETVMYPAFAKWVQSHRDLPMRINQWNNVVRWEFKQPTPFLRTREFLWQEGHSAFATKAEAEEEVYAVLELYARIYEELMAIPVVRGRKTEKEKFAGGDFTTTTEVYIRASGRAIQGATSHHLGQNFSRMFDIVFDDPNTREKSFAFQNSWGVTTRTIGVMVMVHGDDKGLVLPPRVAPVQVVIIPVGVTASTSPDEKEALFQYCSEVMADLKAADFRVKCDFRDHVTPPWKFNHWELKGVPLRIEVGPRELMNKGVYAVRRDTGEKQSLDRAFIERRVHALLESVHEDMYARAHRDLEEHKVRVDHWPDFVQELDRGNLMVAPFCGVEECEDAIKKDSAREEPAEPGAPAMGAKGLCIPFEQPGGVGVLRCIHSRCSRPPKFFTMFGRSY